MWVSYYKHDRFARIKRIRKAINRNAAIRTNSSPRSKWKLSCKKKINIHINLSKTDYVMLFVINKYLIINLIYNFLITKNVSVMKIWLKSNIPGRNLKLKSLPRHLEHMNDPCCILEKNKFLYQTKKFRQI